ncbi:MAG: hypothetical protein WC480_00705 [Patescibacteria group bacterium]
MSEDKKTASAASEPASGVQSFLRHFVPDAGDFTVAAIAAFVLDRLFGIKQTIAGAGKAQAVGTVGGLGFGDEAASMEVEAKKAHTLMEGSVIVDKELPPAREGAQLRTKKETVKVFKLDEAALKAADEAFNNWYTHLPTWAQDHFRQVVAATKSRDDLPYLYLLMGSWGKERQDDWQRTQYCLDHGWIKRSPLRGFATAMSNHLQSSMMSALMPKKK